MAWTIQGFLIQKENTLKERNMVWVVHVIVGVFSECLRKGRVRSHEQSIDINCLLLLGFMTCKFEIKICAIWYRAINDRIFNPHLFWNFKLLFNDISHRTHTTYIRIHVEQTHSYADGRKNTLRFCFDGVFHPTCRVIPKHFAAVDCAPSTAVRGIKLQIGCLLYWLKWFFSIIEHRYLEIYDLVLLLIWRNDLNWCK